MSLEDQEIVWADFMSSLSAEREELTNMLKGDLLDAVQAVDQWVVDNQASYNSALPEVFRTNATPEQKAMLLMYVVTRRYLVGA